MRQLFFALFLLPFYVNAQNVGIGTTTPDASAKLEIQSNSGGVLIPRLTIPERNGILSPAVGLMIFNSDAGRFEFYSDSGWVAVASTTIISDADGDTKVEVERNADDDRIIFEVGGKEGVTIDSVVGYSTKIGFENLSHNIILDTRGIPQISLEDKFNINMGYETFLNKPLGRENVSIGLFAGRESDGRWNVNIGSNAARREMGSQNINIGRFAALDSDSRYTINLGTRAGANAESERSIHIGNEAGQADGGELNVYIGENAGRFASLESSTLNTFVGADSGYFNNGGNRNSYFGSSTGRTIRNGFLNTFLGSAAGSGIIVDSVSFNTFIGASTGHSSSGSQNVFLGYQAGYEEAGSHRLHIANNFNTSLIYGEFDNQLVEVRGEMIVNNPNESEDPFKVQLEGSTEFQVHDNGGVSIGTSSKPDAAGLIVANLIGTTHADIRVSDKGKLYRDSGMKYKSFSPWALKANNASDPFVGHPLIISADIPVNGTIGADMELPDGATLQSIAINYDSFNFSEVVRGVLYKKPLNSFSSTLIISFADSNPFSGVKTFTSSNINEVIDNENFSYFFILEGDVGNTSTIKVTGVKLGYTKN